MGRGGQPPEARKGRDSEGGGALPDETELEGAEADEGDGAEIEEEEPDDEDEEEEEDISQE